MIYLASYKGQRVPSDHSLKAFYNSFQDALIRLLTKGVYSHCEIAILRIDGRYDCYNVIFHSTEGWRFSLSDLTAIIQDLIHAKRLKTT